MKKETEKFVEIEERNPFYLLGFVVILLGYLISDFNLELLKLPCVDNIGETTGFALIALCGMGLIIFGCMYVIAYFTYPETIEHYVKER